MARWQNEQIRILGTKSHVRAKRRNALQRSARCFPLVLSKRIRCDFGSEGSFKHRRHRATGISLASHGSRRLHVVTHNFIAVAQKFARPRLAVAFLVRPCSPGKPTVFPNLPPREMPQGHFIFLKRITAKKNWSLQFSRPLPACRAECHFMYIPPGRNRTCDRLLKRELLYQLSYGRAVVKVYPIQRIAFFQLRSADRMPTLPRPRRESQRK